MIVCANCGAEVEGRDACPRCGAPVSPERTAKALALASGLIGAAFGLGAAAGMIVDFAGHGTLGWSLVGLTSSVEAWLLIGFPMLEYRRPRLFLPIMGLSAIAYLWLLELLAGGSWFLPIALPIALASVAAAALSVFLCAKAPSRGPNIAAFVLIGGTIVCLAVENVLSLDFSGRWSFTWSAIVAVSVLPTALLLLGIQKRVRSRHP